MSEEKRDDWFEFSLSDLADAGSAYGRPRKLRLYADHNFPRLIVDELRGAGIPVTTALDDRRASHDDGAIYARARKLGRVLLTLDGDFWNDREHSLLGGPGVILVEIPGEDTTAIVEGLAIFYAIFAKHFSLDWWPGTKARINRDGFVLKFVSWASAIAEYGVRLSGGRVLVREIRSGSPPESDLALRQK